MKQARKILHLIHSGGLYGAENVIINLSIGLRSKGYKSIVGCFVENNQKPAVGAKAESLGFATVYFKMKNGFDPRCITDLARYCRNNQIDIVHSHGYKPSMICLLLKVFFRIPYVITCHLWFIRNMRLRIYTFFERFSMLFAEGVIGVSKDIVNSLASAGIPKRNLILIENGIDIERFSNSASCSRIELRRELGLQESSLIIGSLGRLTEQKDYKTLIKAAAEILKRRNGIEFIIAGEGHLRSELISLCKELTIDNRFHFLGFRKDSENILELMDIFVLSSLDEGLPIAMLEAMATRLPIITTGVGAIPDVIMNGKNGIIIEKGDYKLLERTLLSLIYDKNKRNKLGSNAYDTVTSKYSNKQMAINYLDVYKRLV